MIDHSRLSAVIEDIAGFMHGTADYERDDRLWPASYLVFGTNPMSLAYGAAGNALFLHRAQGGVPRRAMEWMLAKKIEARQYPPGLFVGSAGIAYVFGELGEWDRARAAMDACYASPLLLHDATLFHGAAGWGLVSLYMFAHTGEARYAEQAAVAADAIVRMAEWDGDACTWTSTADGVVNLGFGYGASGVALFLLRAGQRLARADLVELGRRALAYDLSNRTEDRFGWSWPARKGHHVALPYWGHGACGVGITALRYHDALGASEHRDAAVAIADSVYCKWTVLPGLIDGISGLGDFMLDMYRSTGDEQYLARAHDMASTALWYQVRRPPGIAFPGRWLNRLATDYATGSAGIGLFLHRLLIGGPKPVVDMVTDAVEVGGAHAATPPAAILHGAFAPHVPLLIIDDGVSVHTNHQKVHA